MKINGITESSLKVRVLTLGYLIALTLIALFSILNNRIVDRIILQSRTDAPLINLSGRQRMLSQKLAKELLLYHTSRNPERKQELQLRIDQTVSTWSRVHIGLQSGDTGLELPGNNSENIKQMYNDLNPCFDHITRRIEQIFPPEPTPPTGFSVASGVISDLVTATEDYLSVMDKIVFQYEQEARAHVDHLRTTERFILAIVLLLLVVEALFIFRPMVRHVRRSFMKIVNINHELQRALKRIQTLKGMLPICASCKKIRDDKGYWRQIENYIQKHSEAKFSHGICPDCAKKLYPDLELSRSGKREE